jgi:tripartite-type tricarboxylate transporter receptor subunit TctC
MFATSLSVASYIRAEKVRALAVSTAKRSQSFANLPTIAEAGVPGFDAATWHGVVAPAGTPQPIITRLNGEINRLLQSPDIKDKLTAQGAEIIGGTPQSFAAYIQAEIPKWTKVIRDSGARAE